MTSLKSVGIIITVALCGCNNNKELNDFDMVCRYFYELEKLVESEQLTSDQRNDFIMSRLDENLPASPARTSWEAVSYAIPEDRYEIYKTGAESALGVDWSCRPMEKLAPLTGVEL